MSSKNSETNVVYTTSPLYWTTGFTPCISTLFSSNTLYIVREETPIEVKELYKDVQKYKINVISMNTTILAAILHDENHKNYDLESLKSIFAYGSSISKRMREKFVSKFPEKQLFIGYGLTELSVSITKPNEYKKENAVGSSLVPYVEVKVIDDDGNRLGINEVGEICIKSPHAFIGYFDNKKETEEAFDEEGFFRSGDIGKFDEDGILYVFDRKKEILKSNGYQVNPSEVENVIQELEGIEQVSVVGIENDFVGHLITAAVVRKQGYEALNEKEIIDYVASKLSDYKCLHGGVYFFDKLPMTPSNKIQKRFVLENILKIRNNLTIDNEM